MKKSLSILLLIAAAAMAFSSCNKEELFNESQNENNGSSYIVNIQAGSVETKSQFGTPDGTHYPVLWTDDIDACFSLDGAKFVPSSPAPSSDQKESSFTVEFTTDTKAEGGVIYGFSPSGTYSYSTSEPSVGGFSTFKLSDGYAYLVLPSNQTPLATSVDPAAQALYGSVNYDENGIPDPVKIVFDHAVAYGKMTITNYAGDYESISITFPSPVAGNSCKYYVEDKNGFCAGDIDNAALNTINIDPTNVQNNVIWFAIAPTGTITSGNIVVEIENTQGHKYTKTITLSSQKSIAFNAGEISKFTVNMNGIQPASDTWTLVTDASTLQAGDQLVIASNDKGKTASSISGDFMTEVSSTFSADKSTITSLGEGTIIFTLGGDSEAWTLSSTSGLLGATAVKKVAWDKGTTTWTISISSNNATISNTTGTYGRFLHNVSSTRFTTYTSATSATMLLPQLYKKSSGTIDTRTPRNLAYSSNEATAVMGANFSAPVLSGVTEGGVTYTSSNGSVATIDATGAVTIIAAGTTTITATAAANETYQEGVAAYILTVVTPKITSVSGTVVWDWDNTDSQELTVNGDYLHGIMIDDSGLSNFEAVVVDNTILVCPLDINKTGSDISESFTVTATDGNSVTVTLTQKKYSEAAITLWAETWQGGTAGETPTAYGQEGTTVYNNGTVTYSHSNNSTKLYDDTMTTTNLLLAKKSGASATDGGTWTISGIPTASRTTLTLSFQTNNTTKSRYAISTTTTGITLGSLNVVGSSNLYTVTATITVAEGVKSFDLTFSNSTTSNVRMDDISIIAE